MVLHRANRPAAAVEIDDHRRARGARPTGEEHVDLLLRVRAVGDVFVCGGRDGEELLRGGVHVGVFACRLASEDGGDRAQEAIGVEVVRHEVRAFGVFVPTVDVDRAGLAGILLGPLLGDGEAGAEDVGRVVREGDRVGVFRLPPGVGFVETAARRRIPARRHVGDVRKRGAFHLFEAGGEGGGHLGVVVLPVMGGAARGSARHAARPHVVVGQRVDAARLARFDHLRPHVLRVEVDLAEAGGAHPRARLVELGLDDGGVGAMVLVEVVEVEEREEELAVLAPVFRTRKVARDAVVDEAEELLLRVREGHQAAARRAELRTELVVPLVVAPHERELHAVAVGRLQKPLLQRLLLRDLPVVPIVVVEEHVDAGVRGKRDLLRHVLRVGLVEVAGIRHHRLLVVGIERTGVLHERPLALLPLVGAEPLVALRVLVPVRVEHAHALHLPRPRPQRRQREQGGYQRAPRHVTCPPSRRRSRCRGRDRAS